MSESSDLSDIEAPGTRNAQDETPIIIETPARPPRNRVDDRRLMALSQRYVQQTRTILNTPGGANAIASRVAQAFQPYPRIQQRPQQRRTRGRPTNVFQVRFFAVRDPTTNRGQNFDRQDLASFGLGDPPAERVNRQGNSELLLSWDARQLRQHIEQLFPTLDGVDYELLYNPNRRGLEVIDADTPADIKAFYQQVRSSRSKTAPRVIIRPTRRLGHIPMNTPTVHMREPRAVVTAPARSVTETDANPAPEPIEVTRQIREEQDAAYNRSLQADQEQDRLQAISEQREERRRHLEQARSEELRQLRETMRQSVPEQPDVGINVRLRFPEGDTTIRRFDPSMTVEALINLAGSNDNSSRQFQLHLPWSRQVINSNSHQNPTLAEIGLLQSSSIDVEWINEMSESSDLSDIEAPGTRNAQDETPIIIETPARPPRNRVDDRRLMALSQRYVQQTRTILNTPGGANAIASRVAQAFQPYPRIQQRPQQRRTRGRPTNVFQVRFFAVRDPTTNRGQNFDRQDLASFGLGDPPAERVNRQGNSELLLSWDARQLRQHIEQLFPTLDGVDYELLYNPNRRGLEVIDADTPADIKAFYQQVRSSRSKTAPRVIIRPTRRLGHIPMNTPTVHMREPRAVVTAPACSVTETDANPAPEPIEVTRQIREEQDAAYNRSLQADQEQDRLQAISEQREERRRHLEQARSEELRQLRETMRQSVPEQPDVGINVRLRFPEGDTTIRRFDPSMTVEALINLAGSNDNSSRQFQLHLPWSRQVINSNSHQNPTLAEIGLLQSSSIDVNWINEPAEEISPSYHTPAASPQRDMTISPASSPLGSIPTPPTPAPAASPTPVSSHSGQVERLLQIRRSFVVDDMLAAMASDDVLESDLRVSFVDEQAVDERGVLRDVLSAFWEGAIDRFFEGEGSVVPALTEGATQQTWRAIGRILTAGWRQVGFLPIQVNLTSLAATFLEGDQEVTVSSWVETFGGAEREALLHPRADDPMIMDIITRYGARNVPSEGSLQEQLTRCAYVDMIQRPFFAYDAMGARGTFESLIELEEAYTRLIPNPGVVAEMVRCTPSNHAEQATLDFLIRAIRNMDQATLQLFLRFVSGSSALVVPHININFVPLTGFGRRVVAHTCSVTLDLPIYYSYREFRLELYAVLRGGHWEMDFI